MPARLFPVYVLAYSAWLVSTDAMVDILTCITYPSLLGIDCFTDVELLVTLPSRTPRIPKAIVLRIDLWNLDITIHCPNVLPEGCFGNPKLRVVWSLRRFQEQLPQVERQQVQEATSPPT